MNNPEGPPDGWVECLVCQELVDDEEAQTCESGETFCPACWADLTKDFQRGH